MSHTTLKVTGRDPVVSRDGRPFGSQGGAQGTRMRSLAWPLPSVVAGSLRTTLGKAAGRDFSEDTSRELLQVSVAGLFPLAEDKLYLPAPNDCVVDKRQKPLRARPRDERGGCDWSVAGLRPVIISEDDAPDDFKPEDAPAWWPLDRYAAWLTNQPEPPTFYDGTFLMAPEAEDRTHVQLDADRGASEESLLFTTTALPLGFLPRFGAKPKSPFTDRYVKIALMTRVEADQWAGTASLDLKALHPLGGERRLVHWETTNEDVWNCPPAVSAALAETDQIQVRMDLVTPAIFAEGWKPGWLNHELTGTPPCGGPSLRLVGVCIQRWQAVSGWSLAVPRGPKPVKRMVPAGGVYFFKVVSGNAAELTSRWFRSVSDHDQDQRDGFGLAAWGIW